MAETYFCQRCQNEILLANQTLHDLRCPGINQSHPNVQNEQNSNNANNANNANQNNNGNDIIYSDTVNTVNSDGTITQKKEEIFRNGQNKISETIFRNGQVVSTRSYTINLNEPHDDERTTDAFGNIIETKKEVLPDGSIRITKTLKDQFGNIKNRNNYILGRNPFNGNFNFNMNNSENGMLNFSDMNSNMRNFNNNMNDFNNNMNDFNNRMNNFRDNMNNNMNNFNNNMNDFNNRMNNFRDNMNNFNSNMNLPNNNFNGFNMNNFNNRMSKFHNKMAKLNNKMANLSNRMNNLNNNMNNNMSNFNNTFNMHESGFNNMSNRMNNNINNGVGQDILDRLETSIINDISRLNEDKKQCKICLENFRNGDQVLYLPCFDVFHKNCILNWLEAHDECPICKLKLTRDIFS